MSRLFAVEFVAASVLVAFIDIYIYPRLPVTVARPLHRGPPLKTLCERIYRLALYVIYYCRLPG